MLVSKTSSLLFALEMSIGDLEIATATLVLFGFITSVFVPTATLMLFHPVRWVLSKRAIVFVGSEPPGEELGWLNRPRTTFELNATRMTSEMPKSNRLCFDGSNFFACLQSHPF